MQMTLTLHRSPPNLDGVPLMHSCRLISSKLYLLYKYIHYFDHKFKICRVKPNLNKKEVEAFQSLQQNKNIIIKPADKGGAAVMMDTEQYLWEGYRELSDTTY